MTHRFDEEIVQAIARDAGILPAIVREVHVREWQRLEREARIKDFLPLLVMKHVREHFMRDQGTHSSGGAEARNANHGTARRKALQARAENFLLTCKKKKYGRQAPLATQSGPAFRH